MVGVMCVVLIVYDVVSLVFCLFFFFFNDTATTEIYTLSLHDALPISCCWSCRCARCCSASPACPRSEEHTSELQSRENLVCRLLLEKKKKQQKDKTAPTQKQYRENIPTDKHQP